MEKPTREPIFRITDLETIKVVVDPLRLQIMEILGPSPKTINFVAGRLGLSSSRLYYHFNLLEKHGLIRVVETRMVNNIMEKIYWTTAEELSVDNELLKISSEDAPTHITQLLNSTMETIREDIFRSLDVINTNQEDDGDEQGLNFSIYKFQKRINTEAFLAFQDKLMALLDEFNKLNEVEEDDPDMQVVNVATFLYPSHYYMNENQEDNKE